MQARFTAFVIEHLVPILALTSLGIGLKLLIG